ncbi:hypothetical protein LUZ61_009941 [Rhynchospora tenuis]|uniref:F-box domain-containing protein n=1 Tax=Rhynchospora tenuis TaxID=198213 RepID=A0AAD5ZY64_9POAL|nr:hypothetical protein LUZ61_009941 [Rhynchospora tenuis]
METIDPSLPLEAPEGVLVDWSDLPVDLLQEISKKLLDIFDFVYFRAVCNKWRAATSISDLPPQLPWLLLQDLRYHSESICFYALFSDKIRTIHYPMARSSLLSGPSHGYLYVDGGTCSLFNPLTKDEVTIKYRKDLLPFLVSMGPDPIGSDDYMAFFVDNFFEMTGFYRLRSCEWKFVSLPLNTGRHYCFKGMYYMNENGTGNTVVFNIACGSSFMVPSPKTLDSSDYVFFVESAGKILRIVQHLDLSSDVSTPNIGYDIYQLNVEDEIDQSRWVKANSIGNQILFLDSFRGISTAVRPSTGLRANCIYYIINRLESSVHCGLYKYNISDGQLEKILCPFNNGWTWLVPNLVSSLPAGHN